MAAAESFIQQAETATDKITAAWVAQSGRPPAAVAEYLRRVAYAQTCVTRDRDRWDRGISNTPAECCEWVRGQLLAFGMLAAADDVNTHNVARYAEWVANEYLMRRTTLKVSEELTGEDEQNYWRAIAVASAMR